MSTKRAEESQHGAVVATPKVVEADSLADRIKSMTKTIAERAYELFHGRDGAEGSAVEDWLQAEAELLGPMAVEVREDEAEVVVSAHVPGFKAEDVTVSVEPTRLTITGRHDEASEHTEGERVYTERSSSEIYRTLHLPSMVEAGQAATMLSDGVLTVTMRKPPKPETVEAKPD